jgi:hypothetical protein
MRVLGLGPTCLPSRRKVLEKCYLPVSVYTLPLRVRSRGRAPARPMGFPPPLVPHINCEPRRPLPTERWDWVVCRNALWVNRLWSAIYPYHSWAQRPQSPPSSSCPMARKLLHRASVPETGTLAVFSAHRSPEGDPHVIRSYTIFESPFMSSPSTSGSCLLP